ncbi:transposase [Rummeliibacillus sp. BSL5]
MRHQYEIKEICEEWRETVECSFADVEERHGMRWTTLKGLKKLSMQMMLSLAAQQNVKKPARWTWSHLSKSSIHWDT